MDFDQKRKNFSRVESVHYIARSIIEEISFKELNNFFNHQYLIENDDFALTLCPTNFDNIIRVKNKTASDKVKDWKFISNSSQIEFLWFKFFYNHIDYMAQDKEMSGSTFQSIKRLMSNSL